MHISNRIICFLVLALLTGCKTGTRLGYLIPANRNSESEKGEVVRIDFIAKPGTNGTTGDPGLIGAIGVTAAKLGIEFVKEELEKEAAKYQAQFSKTLVLNTLELSRGGYIVLTRWVDPRKLHLTDKFNRVRANTRYSEIIDGFFRNPHITNFTAATFPYTNNANPIDELKKKQLAFMFVADIQPASAGASAAYTIKPHFLWAWQSKAKVVDLSLAESWKVWQIVGALIFKTDNQVNYKIQPTIKALAQTEDGVVTMMPIDPSSPAVLNMKHKLHTPKDYWFSDRERALLGVPLFEKERGIGYFTVEITVSESDASNVREYLLKGARKIEEEKPKLLKALGAE